MLPLLEPHSDVSVLRNYSQQTYCSVSFFFYLLRFQDLHSPQSLQVGNKVSWLRTLARCAPLHALLPLSGVDSNGPLSMPVPSGVCELSSASRRAAFPYNGYTVGSSLQAKSDGLSIVQTNPWASDLFFRFLPRPRRSKGWSLLKESWEAFGFLRALGQRRVLAQAAQ